MSMAPSGLVRSRVRRWVAASRCIACRGDRPGSPTKAAGNYYAARARPRVVPPASSQAVVTGTRGLGHSGTVSAGAWSSVLFRGQNINCKQFKRAATFTTLSHTCGTHIYTPPPHPIDATPRCNNSAQLWGRSIGCGTTGGALKRCRMPFHCAVVLRICWAGSICARKASSCTHAAAALSVRLFVRIICE